mmetsp:Transcript_51348/g.123107  ORF Transcript_51348/g.123107 Transcript_51348/m.123107 type:complete len:210 (+) Transcript_51348:110-739(+)
MRKNWRLAQCLAAQSAAEKELDILGGKPLQRLVAVADRAIKDRLLLLLQLHDFLLDGFGGHEADGFHWAELTDAVSALDGLCFSGRVPPGVHQEDVVRCLQVQAFTSGFQGDQQDLQRGLCLEGHDDVVPGNNGHAAQHRGCGDALTLQAPLNDLQEAGELREDQRLACGICLLHPLDLLHQSLDLGGASKLGCLDLLHDAITSTFAAS